MREIGPTVQMRLDIPNCYSICQWFGKNSLKHCVCFFPFFSNFKKSVFSYLYYKNCSCYEHPRGQTLFTSPTLTVCSRWSCSLAYTVKLFSFDFPGSTAIFWTKEAFHFLFSFSFFELSWTDEFLWILPLVICFLFSVSTRTGRSLRGRRLLGSHL